MSCGGRVSIISFICHLYQKIFDLFCFLETHLEVWRVSIACSLDGAVEAIHLNIFLSFCLTSRSSPSWSALQSYSSPGREGRFSKSIVPGEGKHMFCLVNDDTSVIVLS